MIRRLLARLRRHKQPMTLTVSIQGSIRPDRDLIELIRRDLRGRRD
jgi:hypothetical protein